MIIVAQQCRIVVVIIINIIIDPNVIAINIFIQVILYHMYITFASKYLITELVDEHVQISVQKEKGKMVKVAEMPCLSKRGSGVQQR